MHVSDIKSYAAIHHLDYVTLMENLIHRTYVMRPAELAEEIEKAHGMIEWQRERREYNQRTNYTGSKYDPNLDLAEIAKRIRGEIKVLGVKASVRIERYGGGGSIDIDVREAPFRLVVDDDLTPEAEVLTARIEDIARAYNFDQSDGFTDYYHVNFSCEVTVQEMPV
jgi:hypothetical protein